MAKRNLAAFMILCGLLSAGVSYSQGAIENSFTVETTEIKRDTERLKSPVLPAGGDIYYYFEVLDNPVTDPGAKIEIDPDVPDGLNYRIRVAVFRNPVSPKVFRGITPVYGFSTEGSDLKKYYVGMFRRLSDAREALAEVKGNGFSDAFITSFEGHTPVSANKAALLEQEWGQKPFETLVNRGSLIASADTLSLPPALKDDVKEVLEEATPEAEPALTDSVEFTAPRDTLRPNALKFFLDCRSCDMNYTRQEIPFVNYVRDTREAEVYLLVTNQGAGSGGTQFTFQFLGQGKYEGMVDTLAYTSNPDETWAIIREKKTHMIKLGLMRYVAKTPLFDEIDIKNNGEIKQHEAEDKWNNWVFQLETSPRFNAEATYNRVSFFNSLEISKVTPDLKLEIGLDQFSNTQTYIEDTVTTEYKTRSRSIDNLIVFSLGNHWSAGLNFDIGSSTENNYDLHSVFMPTIEYDIFPYSEATHRQFRIQYSIGYQYNDYIDTTIYNKMYEGFFRQGIRAAYQIQKKWGNVNFSVSASNFLDDFSKNRVDFWGFTRLRIIKGLSLSVNGGVSYINNQINLAAGDLSEAERLLRLKAQATNFYLQGGVGLSYTFGSIYNNVVNPRFGSSGGGGGGGNN